MHDGLFGIVRGCGGWETPEGADIQGPASNPLANDDECVQCCWISALHRAHRYKRSTCRNKAGPVLCCAVQCGTAEKVSLPLDAPTPTSIPRQLSQMLLLLLLLLCTSSCLDVMHHL
ncbi:hypothetical protein ABVT39_007709 [Epinephelus coioides]